MAQCTDCNARIEYTGNGSQRTFTFPFEYLESTDVRVAQYDEEKLEYVNLTYGTDWLFKNPTVIELAVAPDSDTDIVIYRCTDIDQMQATFFPGYSVKADDLNTDFNQLRLAIEEDRCGRGYLEEEINKSKTIYLNRINVDEEKDGLKGDLVKSNSDLTINDEVVATTQWIDNRYWDQCSETTYLADQWVNEIDDTHIPTTGAVEKRLAEVIENGGFGQSSVVSVNGKTGAVSLGLGDLTDVETASFGSIPADGQALIWNASINRWMPETIVPEAPVDSKQYGRQNNSWTEIVSAGGGVGDDGFWQQTGSTVEPIDGIDNLAIDGNGSFDGVVNSFGLTPNYITGTMPVGETTSSWGLWTGRSDDSTVTSQILADGSASFSGDVTVTARITGYSNANGDGGGAIRGYGLGSSGASNVFEGKTSGGSTTSNIADDGSASFAGSVNLALLRVVANGTTYPRLLGTPDGTFYSESSAGVYPWKLNPNGSASFAGSLNLNTANAASGTQLSINKAGGGIGAYFYNDNTSTQFYLNKADGAASITLKGSDGSASFSDGDCNIKDNGRVSTNQYFESFRTEAGGAILTGGIGTWDSQTAENVKITANGSATFGNLPEIKLEPSGNFGQIQLFGGNSASNSCVNIYDGSSTKVSINGDGSASFSGTVTSDINSQYGGSFQAQNINGNGYLWKGYDATGDPGDEGATTGLSSWIKADGSASFKGQVDCSSDGNNVASLVSNGYFQSERTAGTASVFAGQLNGSLTTSILADGSTSFNSQMSVGNVVGSGYRQGMVLVPGGNAGSYLQVYGKNGDINPTFTVYNGDVADNVATIDNAGNASFKGSVDIGDQVEIYRATTNGGNTLLALKSDFGGTKQLVAEITADGTGIFDGDVTSGDFSNTAGLGSLLASTGAMMVRQQSGNGVLWNGLLGNTPTSQIFADGRVVFSDSVTSKRVLSGSSDVLFRGQSDQGQAANSLVDKFVVTASGSASFAGSITAGGYSMANLPQL